jgi:anti-sigma-K factor RskA
MRYHQPHLLQRLAAEYVLGTLIGRARRRFERLMTDSYQVRAAVWGWEQRLSPLAQAAGSVQPRARVWREVQARTSARVSAPNWHERLGLWRGLSLAATAAALVLGIMLALRLSTVAAPQYVAVFNDPQSQPLWVVRADMDRGRVEIKSINASAPAPINSYELWILPPGGAPRSMGVLPTGSTKTEMEMPLELRELFGRSQGMAVTLEPAGGSPTGGPTGPIVYQAAIVTI